MSLTTRVPPAIAYLVATFTAAPTLGGPVVNGNQTGLVQVLDGPVVTADPGPLTLWVGVDDIASGAPAAASSVQQWQPGLGRTNRTEVLSIHHVAQAWSGSDDVAVLRAATAGIMAAVEDLVHADPSLGGTLRGAHSAVVSAAEWRQGPTQRGMAVRVMFSINATAITGAP